jgi:hypothetical protein
MSEATENPHALPHTLVVIGWTGVQLAFLDVSVEEAIRRYREHEGMTPDDPMDGRPISTFAFDDCFGTYSAWGIR